MLFLLVTGQYPFEDPSNSQSVVHTLKRIQCGLMRPFPLHVSASCASLIQALLRQDPTSRLSLEEALNHPFFQKRRAPGPQM